MSLQVVKSFRLANAGGAANADSLRELFWVRNGIIPRTGQNACFRDFAMQFGPVFERMHHRGEHDTCIVASGIARFNAT
jgi:hypothetical protein